ncbi:hypothetical protein [Bacillus hominis]|uniref:hypothetical protein n=1 Tax=Bacillus hominis TaxID=2817478 RepID=UPI001BB37288|nr:hypothetical protein [Bacillus hominis]
MGAMVGVLYGLVSSNFFWGYIIPACIVYWGVNNKDVMWGKDSYDKGMRQREWAFVIIPYVNFFVSLFFIGLFVLKGIFWLLEGFLDDKRNRF